MFFLRHASIERTSRNNKYVYITFTPSNLQKCIILSQKLKNAKNYGIRVVLILVFAQETKHSGSNKVHVNLVHENIFAN
jgi:hypothetical protein